MSLGICPEVSPKFWRLVGVFKSGFLIANRKLWSIAFQWYITWGGRCGWNGSNQGFCLKFWPKTMYFGGHKSGSSDFRGVWDPNILKCQHFWHYPSKIWVKTVKMSYGQAQSLQNCPKASLLLYFLDWTPKMAKKLINLHFLQLLDILMSQPIYGWHHVKAHVLRIPKM